MNKTIAISKSIKKQNKTVNIRKEIKYEKNQYALLLFHGGCEWYIISFVKYI